LLFVIICAEQSSEISSQSSLHYQL